MSYSEHSAYYNNFRRGQWACEAAATCPCRGYGWALSEVDTWHECPAHFDGQRHPEDHDPEDHDEDVADTEPAPVSVAVVAAEDDIPF